MRVLSVGIVSWMLVGCSTDAMHGETGRGTGHDAAMGTGHGNATGTGRLVAKAYDVRAFGAVGDGKSLDSGAINKAIDAAAAAGGGTVVLPAGTYLSVTIRLKSNVCLYLDQGATLLAADPKAGYRYDNPEPNAAEPYQDFGHTHWRNSLIWGENLENVSILGPGRIWGKGLVRSGNGSRSKAENDALKDRPKPDPKPEFGYPNPGDTVENGWGNKAIALKLCRNVILKDFSILHGGHFGILATGVDNFTLDNLKIDTDRDGMDIDACRQVRVSNCSVNSPFDDGICLKASFGLGESRPCENVTVTNCQVSGYDEGTFLDGTYKRDYKKYSASSGPTGRIKFGTESNGGFKNITISNCVFDYCRGLALETVDGGLLEDVTISNITMRDVTNSPIFLRLGSRLRGPKESTKIGALRRILISDVTVYNADARYGSIISGVPGAEIEDVKLRNIRIYVKGGGTKEWAATRPAEKEDGYPEPAMFGPMPAWGLFLRHVKNLELDDVDLRLQSGDARPAIVADDVQGLEINGLKAPKGSDAPVMRAKGVSGLVIRRSTGLQDGTQSKVDEQDF